MRVLNRAFVLIDFALLFIPLLFCLALIGIMSKQVMIYISLCAIGFKLLRNRALVVPFVVFSALLILLNFLFPVLYWERLLPLCLSLFFSAWIIDSYFKKQSWLSSIVLKFRTGLRPLQVKKIESIQLLWDISLFSNTAILGLFMYFGSLDLWFYYSTVCFYFLLGTLISITIFYVEDFKDIIDLFKNSSLIILYFFNHVICFSIFSAMCATFLPMILLLRLIFFWNIDLFQNIIRSITYPSFVFVRLFTKMVRLIDLELIDLSEGKKSPLLVSNHICMFDVVLLFSYIPQIMTFINEKYLKNKLISPIALSCGYIPISKGNIFSRKIAFDSAYDIILRGASLVIYPEGTRSKTGKLGKLNPGVFRMAIENNVNITPAFYTMDRPFLNKTKLFQGQKSSVTLRLFILPEIDVSNMTVSKESIEALMKEYKDLFYSFMQSDKALAYTKI